MAQVGKHVDKFHFPNHVDKWCHENCNPQDVKHLDGVNTPVCEQLFSSINKFTNAKAMNESHFFLLFLYIFDLYNLEIEGKLRSVANPKSEFRYDLIKSLKNVDAHGEKAEPSEESVENLAEETEASDESVENVVNLLENLAVATVPLASTKNEAVSEFKCKLCNATYKRIGMLKLHMKNKHTDVSSSPCKICGNIFENESVLKKHMLDHYKCGICGIQFEELKYLNRHNKVNHTHIICSTCGKECSDKEKYEEHLTEHSQCDICGKRFDKQHKLKRHMKSHI